MSNEFESVSRNLGRSRIKAKRKADTKAVIDKIVNAEDATQEKVVNFIVSKLNDKAPRTPEELWKAFDVLFNLQIPTTSCSPEMVAPFQWVWDLYKDKYTQTLYTAPRGGGKTAVASGLIYLKCNYNEFYQATHAAAQHSQSQVAQQYLAQYYENAFLKDSFESVYKKEARWRRNKSLFRIVTGSQKGLCLSYWSSVQTDHGVIPIGKIVAGNMNVKVKSYNWQTKQIEWKPVIAWHNHGDGGEFYGLITTNQSVSIGPKFTLNHEVALYHGGYKQVGALVSGDMLAFEDYVLSPTQEQIVLGGLLGDASCTVEGRYSFAHGQNQKEYAEWKKNALLDLWQSTTERKGGFGTVCIWHRFRKIRTFAHLRNQLYVPKKTISRDILNRLDKLGLAIWMMDDGNYSKHGKIWCIYTNGFSYEEQLTIQEYFQQMWNVSPVIDKDKNEAHYIRFNVVDSETLTTVVRDYISVADSKKWIAKPHNSDGGIGIVPVEYVGKEKAHIVHTKKYDITVEGNHNFFLANGQLVSNSGQHPNLLTIDEIEFMELDALEQSFACPVDRHGYKKGWHGFSTRQRAFGSMNYLTSAAETGDKQIVTYTSSIFEAMQRCVTCIAIDAEPHGSDMARNKVCPLWEYCRGEKATKSTGFIPRQYVLDAQSTLSRDGFETQYLCLRPTTQGLVLPNFVHEFMSPQEIDKGNYTRLEYIPDQPFYVCTDPAEGGKCVIVLFQVFRGRIFVFDSIILPQCFTTGEAKVALYERCIERQYPLKDLECVVCDPHRLDAVKDWANGDKNGIGAGRAYKTAIPVLEGDLAKIEPGLEVLRRYIRSASGTVRLYINKNYNAALILAIRENHYRMDKTNNVVQGSEQAKQYKDEIDTLRYMVIWVDQKFNRGNFQTSML